MRIAAPDRIACMPITNYRFVWRGAAAQTLLISIMQTYETPAAGRNSCCGPHNRALRVTAVDDDNSTNVGIHDGKGKLISKDDLIRCYLGVMNWVLSCAKSMSGKVPAYGDWCQAIMQARSDDCVRPSYSRRVHLGGDG